MAGREIFGLLGELSEVVDDVLEVLIHHQQEGNPLKHVRLRKEEAE